MGMAGQPARVQGPRRTSVFREARRHHSPRVPQPQHAPGPANTRDWAPALRGDLRGLAHRLSAAVAAGRSSRGLGRFGRMAPTLEGTYVPSSMEWVRDQVETYERTGGAEANTLRDSDMP